MFKTLLIIACCDLFFQLKAQTPQNHELKFESTVHEVLVPVVVRDSHGNPLGNLSKEQFQVFDNGKRQTLTSFTVVRSSTDMPKVGKRLSPDDLKSEPIAVQGDASRRNVIYLFDDLNTRFEDMAAIRDAAVRYFSQGPTEGDRVAVYSFSGRLSSEFTDDPKKLVASVSQLRWRPEVGHGGMQCPDVSYYLADLVVAKGDSAAFTALTNHTMACAHVPLEVAKTLAQAAAFRELEVGAQDTRIAIGTLKRAVRRLSSMSGQRLVVLISTGFFLPTTDANQWIGEVLNLAAKSNVVVNGLSPRGVFVAEEDENVADNASSAKRPPDQNSPSEKWTSYRRETAQVSGDVMRELADGTGAYSFTTIMI